MFKVGDIITGTEDNLYSVTNKNGIYRVVDVVGHGMFGDMGVHIIWHKNGGHIGNKFPVDNDDSKFRLLVRRK